MIQGVLFDVDGVLIDSEPLINKSSIELFKRFGADSKVEDFEPFVGIGETKFLSEMEKFYSIDLGDHDKAKEELYDIYEGLIGQYKAGPMPGVLRFIANCKKAGIKRAVCTSADRRKLLINLHSCGLNEDDFDTIVTSSMVKRTKPAPDIFIAASENLSLAREECIVAEDAVNGQIGAVSGGFHSLGIEGSFDRQVLLKNGAEFVMKDFSDFPDFSDIESFNKGVKKMIYREKLIETAAKVKENAYAPYSNFKVGATILTENNNIYAGCNVENASYGCGICAERGAAMQAIASEGKTVFKAIAIVSDCDNPAAPCGICRQFLSEFADKEMQVYLYSTSSKKLKQFSFFDLLPEHFELI